MNLTRINISSSLEITDRLDIGRQELVSPQSRFGFLRMGVM